MKNNLQSTIERRINPVGKSGKDYIYVCPKCDDKSGHLWVNYDKNKFHCFKCGYKGRSIATLARDLGIDIRFDYDSILNSYNDELDSLEDILTDSKKKVTDYSRNLQILTSYYRSHTKPLSPEAKEYLKKRGISDYWISRFQIEEGINLSGTKLRILNKDYQGRDYSFRIMIPSIRSNGSISYYVCRDYLGNRKNKYINSNQEFCYSSEDVWNLEQVESNHVIICEGVFSAIAVMIALNKNIAVATYGKSISSKSNSENPLFDVTSQGEKLLNKKFQTYTVFYDKDALSSAMSTCKYLYDRGAKVKIATISSDAYGDHADANDLTREEIIECIKNAREYNDLLELEGLL